MLHTIQFLVFPHLSCAGTLELHFHARWYWNRPSGVAKADRDSINGTCQYHLSRSNFVTHFACPMRSMTSLFRGKGYESLFVTAFSFLKSIQRRKVPSGLCTRDTPVTVAWFYDVIQKHVLNFCSKMLQFQQVNTIRMGRVPNIHIMIDTMCTARCIWK